MPRRGFWPSSGTPPEISSDLVSSGSRRVGNPIETRFRVEFHDEPNGRTRLEVRQWLPAHLAGPTNQGWLEALEKLEATLLHNQAAATDAEV